MMSIRLFSSLFLALFLLFAGQPGWGQQPPPPGAPVFSKEELAQMLAPIALYPDALLSQVLMASTYPIEIIEADRWVKRNPGLKGDDLDTALLDKDWDPSVKALCHFPTVLALMSEQIAETTNIGNAFLAQQDDVMAMVQELRAKAYEQGNLRSSAEEKVIVEEQTIIIEPVDPTVVYVPYYDPFSIYGTWWYPDYPPYYWGPPREAIGIGIYYWPGYYFGYPFWAWSSFDWPHHYIRIHRHHRPRYVREDWWRYDSDHWSHFPQHRRGVAYRDQDTARRYGQHPYPNRGYDRTSRGYPEAGEREWQQQFQPRTLTEEQVRERTRQETPPREINDQTGRLQPRTLRKEQIPPPMQTAPYPPMTPQRQEFQPRSMPTEQARIIAPPPAEPYRPPAVQERERPAPNVFNQVDEGRREREFSERGRMSRESFPANEFRGHSFGNEGGGGGHGRPGR